MKLIKMLANDIECNIREAEEKIETAYRLKAVDPNIAGWYRDMVVAHLGFNPKAHDLVTSAINNAKSGKEYMEHPGYYEGMMAMWQDKHAEILAHSARVKSMIDGFK